MKTPHLSPRIMCQSNIFEKTSWNKRYKSCRNWRCQGKLSLNNIYNSFYLIFASAKFPFTYVPLPFCLTNLTDRVWPKWIQFVICSVKVRLLSRELLAAGWDHPAVLTSSISRKVSTTIPQTISGYLRILVSFSLGLCVDLGI